MVMQFEINIDRLKEAIVHSNVCLKRWRLEGFGDMIQIRSMILSHLNRALMETNSDYFKWRSRKVACRTLRELLAFTTSSGFPADDHITNIIIMQNDYIKLPVLDYNDLNLLAIDRLSQQGVHLQDISSLHFNAIININF